MAYMVGIPSYLRCSDCMISTKRVVINALFSIFDLANSPKKRL